MDRHTVITLPEGFVLKKSIDMQKDKKTAFLVNGIAAVLMVVMLGMGVLIIDIDGFFDSLTPGVAIANVALAIAGPLLYMVLHELTHGILMKHYGAEHVKYGFTGLYAFAASERDYFDKYCYLRISLGPVVVWGIVFTLLMIALPKRYLPGLYFLQVTNISSSAGDMYISALLRNYDMDTYVMDPGVEMYFYGQER